MKLLSLTIGGKELEIPAPIPKPEQLGSIINNAITILIIAGVLASLITVVWSGISWTTSGGDKQKLASAKARLTWGIIGLIVIMLSFFIINIWGHFFGVTLLNVSL